MAKTCANSCRFAVANEHFDGHFECDHPATKAIKKGMWNFPDWPEDDGRLPENTPLVVTGTKWLGYPKDCKAWSPERTKITCG